VKTKNRNQLNFILEDDLRRTLTTTQPRIDNLVENVTHKSENHTEVYLAVCFVLHMLKLNKIRCIIVKHLFCLLIFVLKRRVRVDFSIVL